MRWAKFGHDPRKHLVSSGNLLDRPPGTRHSPQGGAAHAPGETVRHPRKTLGSKLPSVEVETFAIAALAYAALTYAALTYAALTYAALSAARL